jgi:hypothetical protein
MPRILSMCSAVSLAAPVRSELAVGQLAARVEANLVSAAWRAPVLALAVRAGTRSTEKHLSFPGSAGSNPGVKVAELVAGMVAGARATTWPWCGTGATGRPFAGVRAPSRSGYSDLRSCGCARTMRIARIPPSTALVPSGRKPCLR